MRQILPPTMNALLLAAGLGKRLRPITNVTPKCLVEINGKPLLQFWLEKLATSSDIEKIFVNTHYFSEKVRCFVQNLASNIRKSIVLVHEDELLGTAGTLKKVIPLSGKAPMFLAHADNLSFFSLKNLQKQFLNRPEGCEITMMTFKSEAPETCGIVSIDSNKVVTAFEEKPSQPKGDLANGAIYIISAKGLLEISNLNDAVDFSNDVIPEFILRINTWHNTIYHRDVGTPEALEKARADITKLNLDNVTL